MISYEVYKFLHNVGILSLLFAVASLSFYGMVGNPVTHPLKKLVSAVHGIAIVLALVSGFGLLARLGIVHGGLPLWVYAKILIWFFFAFALLLVKKKPELSRTVWLFTVFLFILAAWIARFKPF